MIISANSSFFKSITTRTELTVNIIGQEKNTRGVKANVSSNFGVALGVNLQSNGGIIMARKVLYE